MVTMRIVRGCVDSFKDAGFFIRQVDIARIANIGTTDNLAMVVGMPDRMTIVYGVRVHGSLF